MASHMPPIPFAEIRSWMFDEALPFWGTSGLDREHGGFLEEQKKNGPSRKLAGFEVVGRGIARHGYPVFLDGEPAGAVTSGTYAPYLEKNIGLCYLPAARTAVGTDIEVDVRGRRVAARVVPTPFYKRQK